MSPGRGHCVVFLDKTPYSHGVSLWILANLLPWGEGGNTVMDWHPIQEGVEILLVTSDYRNWDKLQPDELVGSYARVKVLP